MADYLSRIVKLGIIDMPNVPFQEGFVLGEVSQSAEDRVFAEKDLRNGCRDRMFERVSEEEVGGLVRDGKEVS